jgi:hypothetical protein
MLFADSFPKVDIEKCVQNALNMCKVTPPSIASRVHGPPQCVENPETESNEVGLYLNSPTEQYSYYLVVSAETMVG